VDLLAQQSVPEQVPLLMERKNNLLQEEESLVE
jgi:hypothetical protein